jgi:hypothetical protein
MIRSPTLEGFSIINLLTWDKTIWTSENKYDAYFSFMLSYGFAFSLNGYKIKSAENYYPISWKVEGITAKRNHVLIDQQNKNNSLCSPYKECTFPIQLNQYFRGFKVTQTGKNAQGNHHFLYQLLNGLEILKPSQKKIHSLFLIEIFSIKLSIQKNIYLTFKFSEANYQKQMNESVK